MLGTMPAKPATPTVSKSPCKTVPSEPSKAVAGMSRKMVLIVLATEIPVMVEVVEAAKAEPE